MKKRKLKPFVLPAVYTLSIAAFVLSMYFVQEYFNDSVFKSDEESEYVDGEIVEEQPSTEEYVPVVANTVTILKPFLGDTVSVAKNYYDYQSEANEQQEAIIFYEDTYMQNSGIDYTSEEVFDVISILDGTVTKVEDNEILGTTIEITHSNDLVSVYQSLSEPSVKVDDVLVQGQVIAKSGMSNLNKDLANVLHFELYHQGMIVNPDEYYNKSLEEL